MKEIHLFYAPDASTTGALPPDEAAHAVRVLRMQEGDPLLLTDGRGTLHEAVVALASPKRCTVSIGRSYESRPLWRGGIHVAIAPTKNMDRMEWMAEKATEIGVDSLRFLDCANSERRVLKTERLEKIVVGAMKQSHKARKPDVVQMEAFRKFIAAPHDGQKFIAHCYRDHTDETSLGAGDAAAAETFDGQPIAYLPDVLSPTAASLVLIGPEGDFSLDEVRAAMQAGFRSVSLGRSRLRTETAALVAVHMMFLAKSADRQG